MGNYLTVRQRTVSGGTTQAQAGYLVGGVFLTTFGPPFGFSTQLNLDTVGSRGNQIVSYMHPTYGEFIFALAAQASNNNMGVYKYDRESNTWSLEFAWNGYGPAGGFCQVTGSDGQPYLSLIGNYNGTDRWRAARFNGVSWAVTGVDLLVSNDFIWTSPIQYRGSAYYFGGTGSSQVVFRHDPVSNVFSYIPQAVLYFSEVRSGAQRATFTLGRRLFAILGSAPNGGYTEQFRYGACLAEFLLGFWQRYPSDKERALYHGTVSGGPFQVGETITSNIGGVGTILSISGLSIQILISSGAFGASNILTQTTGTNAGATATVLSGSFGYQSAQPIGYGANGGYRISDGAVGPLNYFRNSTTAAPASLACFTLPAQTVPPLPERVLIIGGGNSSGGAVSAPDGIYAVMGYLGGTPGPILFEDVTDPVVPLSLRKGTGSGDASRSCFGHTDLSSTPGTPQYYLYYIPDNSSSTNASWSVFRVYDEDTEMEFIDTAEIDKQWSVPASVTGGGEFDYFPGSLNIQIRDGASDTQGLKIFFQTDGDPLVVTHGAVTNGPFVEGDIVSSSSGGTGTVIFVNDASGFIHLGSVSGTFLNGDTLTSGAKSATETADGTGYAANKTVRFRYVNGFGLPVTIATLVAGSATGGGTVSGNTITGVLADPSITQSVIWNFIADGVTNATRVNLIAEIF